MSSSSSEKTEEEKKRSDSENQVKEKLNDFIFGDKLNEQSKRTNIIDDDDPLMTSLLRSIEERFKIIDTPIVNVSDSPNISRGPVFGNRFPDSVTELAYLNSLKAQYRDSQKLLKGVTFVCFSGVYASGKDTCADIAEAIFSQKSSWLPSGEAIPNVLRLSYATVLKRVVADIFGLDPNMLLNRTSEDRHFMENSWSESAKFWSTSLLRSNYTNGDFPRYHTEELLTKCRMTPEELAASGFSESELKHIEEVKRVTSIEQLEQMTPENQFIQSISDPNVSINSSLFPVTPRTLLEDIGSNLFRDHFSKDIWVLSLIVNVANHIRDAKARKLPRSDNPWIILIPDCRFPNEVELPSQYGAKVLFLYIDRESVMKENTIYSKLNDYISNYILIHDETSRQLKTTVYKRRMPSLKLCEDYVNTLLHNQKDEENNSAETNEATNLADENGKFPKVPNRMNPVKWMPIYLRHYMRENFSRAHVKYNQANGKDIFYMRIKNKEFQTSHPQEHVESLFEAEQQARIIAITNLTHTIAAAFLNAGIIRLNTV